MSGAANGQSETATISIARYGRPKLIWSFPRNSPPSILAQVQASASQPQEKTIDGVSSPLFQPVPAIPTPAQQQASLYPPPDWATNIPFGRSPPEARSNEPSLAGSPPDPLQPYDELRAGFGHGSPPSSPSATYRQPVRRNNGFQSFGDHVGSPPGRGRPRSMNSPFPPAPPLPHQIQPHYYGAPEITFGLQPQHGDAHASSDKYWCLFDNLSTASDDGLRVTENVLLVGSEKELNVYRIDKKKLDYIGRLGGLRGHVISAKIINSTLKSDFLGGIQPLVAVILHGRCSDQDSQVSSRPGTSHSEDVMFDPSGSMLQALGDTGAPRATMQYQTSVEIYSLRKGHHVATLFRSPRIEVEIPRDTSRAPDSAPVGDISLQAKGKFIVVSSGTSGEVYIFEHRITTPEDLRNSFKCLGKVWTRTSPRKTRSLSISSNSSETETLHGSHNPILRRPDAAAYSLSHRWLAIVPPLSSAQLTLHGSVDSIRSQKPPGYASHTSPAEPPIICDVITPEGESVLSKVARDVTQEVIKGARWVGDRGVQAWHNYWTKPPEQHALPPYPTNNLRLDYSPQHAFPPTHANDEASPRPSNQPVLVSILDLEKLSAAQTPKPAMALEPMTTFSLPDGCSLVSFSPSGLNLLTASAKGDVQHVWDLLRMIHGENRMHFQKAQAVSEKRPVVREVARFTRMTVAKIIDVVWTEPRGERFALVTDRGTVHIFDMPSSAFQWPPPRRTVSPTSLPGNSGIVIPDSNQGVSPAHASGAFSAAIDLVTGKSQPLLAAVRGRPNLSNAFSGLGGLTFPGGAGAKGGKAVAAGFTKSVDAAAGTVNTLRHWGENRLALPGSPHAAVPGCVRWLSGKDQGLIAVTGKGILRIHSIRQSTHQKAAKRRPSVLGGKPVEISILGRSIGSQKGGFNHNRTGSGIADDHLPSAVNHWLPRDPQALSKATRNTAHPLSCAEIETHAPYQPFHTDRRINFYIYKQQKPQYDPYHLQDSAPWAFGEDIPATRINATSSVVIDDNGKGMNDESSRTKMENFISVEGNEEEGQQVIFTTRRKRGTKKQPTGQGNDEDFFEDDCEVVDFAEQRV